MDRELGRNLPIILNIKSPIGPGAIRAVVVIDEAALGCSQQQVGDGTTIARVQRASGVLPRPCPAEREFPIGPARTRASDGGMHEFGPEMQYVPAVRLNHVGLRVPLALRIPRVRIADDGAEGF